MKHTNEICRERKRNFLGLPWTFTIYSYDTSRLFIDRGFFKQVEDEIRLYRITDFHLSRTFWQRIIGTGTIHVSSGDKTMGDFDIINIKHAMAVKEELSDLVEKARKENRVYTREDMVSPGDDQDHDTEDMVNDDYPDEHDHP